MNTWSLPGPSGFLEEVERSLRDGASVVLRFPGSMPADLEQALRTLVDNSWIWTVTRLDGHSTVFDGLCDRFAPRLPALTGANILDLCQAEEFQGRLIWLDGLDLDNWPTWRTFLGEYAQASRDVPTFGRTLFIAPLAGTPIGEPPEKDVTLVTHDWRDVVDQMDLLFFTHHRLGERRIEQTQRALLATTIAQVSAWDLDIAEQMLDEDKEVILAPGQMLQSIALERGWTAETPAEWQLGTASGRGSTHAALASLSEPAHEIQRRLWSAQASVLFPVIEAQRHEIIQDNLPRLVAYQRNEYDASVEPYALEIGPLADIVDRRGFDSQVRKRVLRLRRARNALAHLVPLPPGTAFALLDS